MALPDGLYDLLLTERQLAGLDLEHVDLAAFNGDRTELLLDALAWTRARVITTAGEPVQGLQRAARRIGHRRITTENDGLALANTPRRLSLRSGLGR